MPDLPPLPDGCKRCRLLVDGYNLMYAVGAIQHGATEPKALQRGREKVIGMISQRMSHELGKRVWIVFDSELAPKDLPDLWLKDGIYVAFSRGWNSGDEMLQAILAGHHSPKQLVVISSDHAVQRKALSRNAQCFDSDHWTEAMDALLGGAATDGANAMEEELRPDHVSQSERDRWLREFGIEDL